MGEAPPRTPVSLTVCRRRSPPWLPPPSRSRSSLPQRGSTPSGSEAPSWPPSPPSSRCGSPSRSTTSADPPLSTASASKETTLRFSQLKIHCVAAAVEYNFVKSNLKFINKHFTLFKDNDSSETY